MSLIGLFATIGLLITGHKPKRFYHTFYFQVGKNWGGINLGFVFLTSQEWDLHTKQHESGHGIQNIILGPLQPFLVCIPSALRYWITTLKGMKAKYLICLIFCSIIILISSSLILTAAFLGIVWLMLISGILLAYSISLLVWSVLFEVPKYKEIPPKYDDAWFEGTATKLGEHFCK